LKQTYAFFDFDGTLTVSDTLTGFTKFLMGRKFWLVMAFFLPILIAYRIGLIKQDRAKSLYLRFFLKWYSEEDLILQGAKYAKEEIKKIINPSIFKRLKWHQQQNHSVYIITASLKYWIEPWCKQNDLSIQCTNIEIVNGKVTGKIIGQNCFGEEKSNRIKQILNTHQPASIYAYGDSIGDYAMLSLANHSFDCSNNHASPYQLANKESWYVG